eukprot:8825768-Pyramimonas_sp.AAC.1
MFARAMPKSPAGPSKAACPDGSPEAPHSPAPPEPAAASPAAVTPVTPVQHEKDDTVNCCRNVFTRSRGYL